MSTSSLVILADNGSYQPSSHFTCFRESVNGQIRMRWIDKKSFGGYNSGIKSAKFHSRMPIFGGMFNVDSVAIQ